MVVFDRSSIPEFLKDLKKIKIPIGDDLKRFEEVFVVSKLKLSGIFQIDGLGKKKVNTKIYKLKKFRCKALNRGTKSGVRITFTYDEEKEIFTYIQIYLKNSTPNHSEERILKYFKEQSNG